MHLQGNARPDDLENNTNGINYADSKLLVLMLCLATARLWKDVYANAVDPGWVPTKMGGSSAPDNLQKGYETQAWLAVSDEKNACVSGTYFFHQKEKSYNPEAADVWLQEKLLNVCGNITGISFSR